MTDFMSRMIEKFKLKEKCSHCQRVFNIYSFFPSYLSADRRPDSILSLPLILVCGHNACEQCMKVIGDKVKCGHCLGKEEGGEQIWDNPHDLYLIDEYKEEIRKSLKESEKKHFSSNCFDGIQKTVEEAQIAIQGGLTAITFKCTTRCSDSVLLSFKQEIKKINEAMEIRAKHIDGDTILKKLQLFRSIFEDEAKMKENLKSDLSALKITLPPKVIKERIMKFQNFGMEQKINTILNMVKNGFDVAIGHRDRGELCWAPVSVSESNVYIGNLSQGFQPSDSAVRIQYEWLYPQYQDNLPNFVFLEIYLNKAFVESRNVPAHTPHKFKLIFKVREFQDDYRVDYELSNEKITTVYFVDRCLGTYGESFIGQGGILSKNNFLIKCIYPIPKKEMFVVKATNVIKESFLYAQKHGTDAIRFKIAARRVKTIYTEKLFIAKLVSGRHNLVTLGEHIDNVPCIDLPKIDGVEVVCEPRITDCGLVLASKHNYRSERWDKSASCDSDEA